VTFLAGGWLWLLLGVVGLMLTYVVMYRRKGGYAVRFTNLELLDSVAPRQPGWRRHANLSITLHGLTRRGATACARCR
jgi:Ca-activated chloride channel family protein